jgi:hypothetical protein
MYSLSFVNQIDTIFRPIKRVNGERTYHWSGSGGNRDRIDPERKPWISKTEMGARLFVLLYIQVICHSPAPDKHLFVEKSVNNCSRLAFSIQVMFLLPFITLNIFIFTNNPKIVISPNTIACPIKFYST